MTNNEAIAAALFVHLRNENFSVLGESAKVFSGLVGYPMIQALFQQDLATTENLFNLVQRASNNGIPHPCLECVLLLLSEWMAVADLLVC